MAIWAANKKTIRPYSSGPNHLAKSIAVANAIKALKTPAIKLTLNLAEIVLELIKSVIKMMLFKVHNKNYSSLVNGHTEMKNTKYLNLLTAIDMVKGIIDFLFLLIALRKIE